MSRWSFAFLLVVLAASVPASKSRAADAEPDAYCSLFEKAARNFNSRPGARLDKWTLLDNVEFDCGRRTMVFNQRVVTPLSDLAAGWKDAMARRWTNHYCSPKSPFAEAVLRHGWSISTTVATTDGEKSTISAECRLPEA